MLSVFAITYDPTISLGNILTLLGILAGAIGVYVRLAERLTALETKMTILVERRVTQREP